MSPLPALRSRRLPSWLPLVAIALAVLAIYWPALHGELLWDDRGHVTPPRLQSWLGLWQIWTDVRVTQQFYPVLHTAFWIEHRLWGDATLGYHLVNLLWHAIAAALFAVVLRRLWSPVVSATAVPARATIPPGAEWIAALLFVAHPLSVESVAWISEQKNTLSAVFYLLAALAYLRFDDQRRPRDYFLASLGFALAVGTKSVTATLPAALLVVIWWRRGRIDFRRDVRPLVPWFALAVVAGLFTAWIERKLIGAEGTPFALSFVERVLLAGRALWFYTGKLLWPADLAFLYERWDVGRQGVSWAFCVLAGLALTTWLALGRHGSRGLLAGWLLFVGTLFPALGFFNVYPFIFSYVADHFQYLASLAFIGTAAGGIGACLALRGPALRRSSLLAALAVATAFAILARKQSRLYVDDETLFRATVAATPDSWMAHHLVGFALSTQGRHEEAIVALRTALQLNPSYPNTHVVLGLELAQRPGGAEEAIAHYRQAIELNPGAADAHNDLGLLLSTLPGRKAEAFRQYEAALRINPDFAAAHANFATALLGAPERAGEAEAHFRAALRLEPLSPEMHDSYARLLLLQPGRGSEAMTEFNTALRLRPNYAEAHAGLGSVLATNPERLAEAVKEFETALRLDPNQPETQFNLGNVLMKLPDRSEEAITHYKAALALRPEFAAAEANLGSALGTQPGHETEAISHYEEALRLQPGVAWVHLALALQLTDLPAHSAEAIAHAQTALRLQPVYPEAHNCLAIVYAQTGRFELAAQHWEEALRQKPNYETARANLQRLQELASPGR